MREWFRVEAAASAQGKKQGGGEILIFSHIGKRWWDDKESVEVKSFVEALKGLVNAGPGDITVRINSPGGDVGGGMTIYNSLRAIKNRVVCRVEGYAYSMASVIALAGRETQMADVAQFMVHNPTTGAWGGKREMERAIKALETATKTLVTAYSKKTGKPAADIEALMEETTFMTADEAKEFGFVDTILDGAEIVEGAVAACFDAGAWRAYYEGHGELPAAGELHPEGHGNTRDKGSEGAGETEAGTEEAPPCPPGGSATCDSGGRAINGAAGHEEKRVMKISEIEKACPGASAEFVNTQMKACEANENLTLADVVGAFAAAQTAALAEERAARAAEQQQHAEALESARAEASKGAPKPPVKLPGLPPLSTAGDGGSEGGVGGDPIGDFDAAVRARMDSHKEARHLAVRAVANAQPELLEAYEAAHTAKYAPVANRQRGRVERTAV